MTKRLIAMKAAVALLAFSAVPSFADHHNGGYGGGNGGCMGVVVVGTAVAGMPMVVTGTVAAGIMVVTAAAGELDPR